MSRLGKTPKRIVDPDPLFNDRVVARLINRAMYSGKKSAAQKQIYQTLDMIAKETKKEALEVLHQALENIKPVTEVRSRRVGGAAYQVPMPVRGDRRESLGIRWLLSAARQRPNRDYHEFYQKLAAEIIDAYNNTGGAIKKKEDTHRMAEANKAFSHFRW